MNPREMDILPQEEANKLFMEAKSVSDLPPITDTIIGNPDAEVGVVLQHGYSGSNLEMIYIANSLALQGYRVILPLLPGHGTTSDDLIGVSHKDWIAKTIAGYDYLREEQSSRKIIAAGHSLGGSLSFILAGRRKVEAIVSLAGPVRYPWYLRYLSKIARPLTIKIPYDEFEFYDDSLYNHPGIEYFVKSYGKTPIKALAELFDLLQVAYETLPQISSPTCLIHSKLDNTVPPYHADIIRERIDATDLEIHWLSHSYHIMVIDKDRELVADKILNFANRILSTGDQEYPQEVERMVKTK